MATKLDPETGGKLNEDDTEYTAAEIASMREPCPRCGSSVSFGKVNVRGLETVGDRHYRIGRPEYRCNCFNG